MSARPIAADPTAQRRRRDLEAIHRAGVDAVEPQGLVAGRLERHGSLVAVDIGERRVRIPISRLWVAGAGKAAVAMARGVVAVAPEARGVVIAPRPGRRRSVAGIEVLRGAHPVPDRSSFDATAVLLRRVRRLPADAVVLFLLSGGASALLARPAPGISRADKVRLGRLLLRCGADVALVNAVRKHVSDVKGGGLLRACAPRRVITLALSDVRGDRLDTIGSGPTVADRSTYADAWRGLENLGVIGDLPERVRRRLRAGVAGHGSAAETLAPAAPEARRSVACVVGSNRIALRAAAREARVRGYRVRLRRTPLIGEAALAGARFAASLGCPVAPTCVLAGGETTVSVGAATGRGGRNQEFAVGAMEGLADGPWSLLAAGTDGIDGPTPAAGGFADGASWRRAGGAAVARALRRHDSYGLLDRLGDTWVTGPTGTNVMDLVVALGGSGGNGFKV